MSSAILILPTYAVDMAHHSPCPLPWILTFLLSEATASLTVLFIFSLYISAKLCSDGDLNKLSSSNDLFVCDTVSDNIASQL